MTRTEQRWLLGGGLGTGKSTVRRLFEAEGVFTIDADSIGHAVLDRDGTAFDDVAARWPSTIVDGDIDRRALGSIVFSDRDQLAELEVLTHPHIFGTIMARLEDVSGVVVVEIPLLDKSPPGEWRRLVVDCEDEIRLHRVVKRGMSEPEARARMAAQPSRAGWLSVADVVIPNHGTPDELTQTVTKVLPIL